MNLPYVVTSGRACGGGHLVCGYVDARPSRPHIHRPCYDCGDLSRRWEDDAPPGPRPPDVRPRRLTLSSGHDWSPLRHITPGGLS
jgi:hypothetical protein